MRGNGARSTISASILVHKRLAAAGSLGLGCVQEPGLEIDCRPQRKPGGIEDDERLVPPALEQPPASSTSSGSG